MILNLTFLTIIGPKINVDELAFFIHIHSFFSEKIVSCIRMLQVLD